jgi:hypothetical protein
LERIGLTLAEADADRRERAARDREAQAARAESTRDAGKAAPSDGQLRGDGAVGGAAVRSPEETGG